MFADTTIFQPGFKLIDLHRQRAPGCVQCKVNSRDTDIVAPENIYISIKDLIASTGSSFEFLNSEGGYANSDSLLVAC